MRGGRLWFSIHSACGVLLGLMLFLVCWTGAFATLSREVDWMLNPVVRAADGTGEATWGQLEAGVAEALPDAELVSIMRPIAPGFAAEALVNDGEQELVRVYLDPHTGRPQGSTSFFNVQRFFRSFHRELFAVWGIGRWIVVAAAIPLLLAAIAPLFFYRRWWRGFFRLELKKGLRVAASSGHKLVGVWSLGFALLMGLTGAWWAAEYMGVTLGYPDLGQVAEAPEIAEGVKAEDRPIDQLVADARRAWPQLDVQAIQYPTDAPSSVVLFGDDGSFLVRESANQMTVSRLDGAVLARHQASALGWPARWVDTVDPLHFGTFGGLPTKILWALFGLGLAFLCLSGTYLHYRRRVLQSVRNDRVRWPATSAAITATVMTLVATASAGWEEYSSYGVMVDGVQMAPEVPGAVTAFLVSWIVLTMVIVVGWCLALCRPHGFNARAAKRPQPVVATDLALMPAE